MNQAKTALRDESATKKPIAVPVDDERYPGSFFRIPAPPVPGKTGWSLR